MSAGAIISAILGIGAVAGTIIWGIVHNKNLKPIDVPMNAKIVINFTKKNFTNGYSFGLVNSVRENHNGTTLVRFYPMDVEQGDKAEKVALQKVVVANEDLISIGDASARRNILIITGKNPTAYPKSMRETLEGKYMTTEGLKSYLIKTFGEGVTAGDLALVGLMREWARGEATGDVIEKLKEEKAKAISLLNMRDGNTPSETKKEGGN